MMVIFESRQHTDCVHKSEVVPFKSHKMDYVWYQIYSIPGTSFVIEPLRYVWNYLS